MITFFLNSMGPASVKWYEDNNIPYTEEVRYSKIFDKEYTYKKWHKHYSCGRIDIHGVPNEPYGLEYSVHVMERDSWELLSDYLYNLEIDYLPSKEELFTMFEEDTGYTIKWFNKD